MGRHASGSFLQDGFPTASTRHEAQNHSKQNRSIQRLMIKPNFFYPLTLTVIAVE
jgi:hypothetical protein